MKSHEIIYEVFAGREGRLTVKRKGFKTEQALFKFAEKLVNTDNFHRILYFVSN